MVGYTVHLYSTNEQTSFSSLDDKENYIEHPQESSTRVAVQQEDLHLLARTLQEQFLAEVPSGEFFQLKCGVSKDGLMILTQHPVNVKVDIEQIFVVLEEALQSFPPYREQQIQCFVRILGEKLPYAKRSLTMKGYSQEENFFIQTDNEDSRDEQVKSSSSLIFPPTYFSPTNEEEEEEEIFDPLAGTPDLLVNPRQRRIKSILFGASAGVAILGGCGGYLLTRPCVMSECQEFQAAKQLNTEFKQLLSRAKSEKELATVKQQLETTSTALTVIPLWASYYQQAAELKTDLSTHAEKIHLILQALEAAKVAEQKNQTPPNTQAELQARQKLWRQVITPLESVSLNSEMYKLVQPKLLKYRGYLQSINQQLLNEEKWVKKLANAKGVASVANKWETSAKSLKDWQKLQSTWQVVISALNIIPPSSPAYQEAQKLLLEYKPQLARARDRVTIEQLATKTYQQVLNVANQAKAYEQKQQWQAAVVYWQQALQTAKQISNNSLYYSQAQSLITPYSVSLKEAQEKLQLNNTWQQTRTDLNKTCVSQIRICNFTVDEKGIIVKITPEYEQLLQSNSVSETNPQNPSSGVGVNPISGVGVANHWQTLQVALTVISQNANLPLFIYNVQGQAIYMRTPAD